MNNIFFEFTLGEKIPQEVLQGKMKINKRIAIRGIIFFEDKLLMIKTSKGDYKFPGGGKEKDESDFQTLNREVQEETGFVNLIKDESKINLIGKILTQNIDTENPNLFFVMESFYYIAKLSSKEIYELKNLGQNLDEYEKELNFEYSLISVEEALEKNKSLLIFQDEKAINFWVERETLVLEELKKTRNSI